MSPTDIFAGSISFDNLQLFKRLEPLARGAIEELERVQALDISGFNEAEVRSFIIDPIVRALGYAKGTDFSVDLERSIDFLGKKKFPDYNLNLWREDFWLIEAKRPRGAEAFDYEDLAQAVEYACHPKINAALVVLCDGAKIEVFDREDSLIEPVLRVPRDKLVEDFEKIRLLLDPWQVWFFQKRRVVRLIDKVFDHEFNMQRVEEFQRLVTGRLSAKRIVILENFRKAAKPDTQEERERIKAATLEDLVEIHMFQQHSIATTNQLTLSLADLCIHNTFQVTYRMLPDMARDMSDLYVGHAMAYLWELDRRGVEKVQYLPKWLASGPQVGADLKAGIRRFLQHGLSYFADDEPRRLVLLAAATHRRILKVLLMLSEGQWNLAEAQHFIRRFEKPELTWQQFVGSPAGHALGMLNATAMLMTDKFVKTIQTDDGLKVETAKIQLKQLWTFEKTLLSSVTDYPKIKKERDLGELFPTEWSCLTHDYLGHVILCLLPPFPAWREYVLQNHQTELMQLARMGSWSAREVLGIDKDSQLEAMDDKFLADRFFLGDVTTLQFLRARYQGNTA